MSAIPNGAHTLILRSIEGSRRGLYTAHCSNCKWNHMQALPQVIREAHDEHLQAVMAETEASDASA